MGLRNEIIVCEVPYIFKYTVIRKIISERAETIRNWGCFLLPTIFVFKPPVESGAHCTARAKIIRNQGCFLLPTIFMFQPPGTSSIWVPYVAAHPCAIFKKTSMNAKAYENNFVHMSCCAHWGVEAGWNCTVMVEGRRGRANLFNKMKILTITSAFLIESQGGRVAVSLLLFQGNNGCL